MEKSNSRERSDKIAILSAIGSVIAIILSIVMPFTIYNLETKENIDVALLPLRDHYIHVEKVTHEFKSLPFVEALATWKKIRFTNNSRDPISIISLISEDDSGNRDNVYGTLYQELEINNSTINPTKPIELPLHLEAKISKDYYVLVPFRVSPTLGTILIPMMRGANSLIDTEVENALFNDEVLANMEKDINMNLKKRLTPYGIMGEVAQPLAITLDRDIIYKKDGIIYFRDQNNSARDGFIARDIRSVYIEVIDSILGTTSLNMTIFDHSKSANLVITLGSGKQNSLPLWQDGIWIEKLH